MWSSPVATRQKTTAEKKTEETEEKKFAARLAVKSPARRNGDDANAEIECEARIKRT